MKKIILLFLLAVVVLIGWLKKEQLLKDFFQGDVRVAVEQYVGEESAKKILGEKPKSIELPKIPEINSDTKSDAIYQLKDKPGTEFSNLPPETQQKYNYAFVKELFEVTRRTKPTDDDLREWINVLDQGGSREGVYQAIVLDDVYAALENYDDAPTDHLISFAQHYMNMYLNRGFDEKLAHQLNVFSLKRIIVSNTLDLIDTMRVKRDDVENWYAVLSSDLAKIYPDVFTSKIRHLPSKEVHKKWTEQVSMDHIKGEVIIKLHKVCNSLM